MRSTKEFEKKSKPITPSNTCNTLVLTSAICVHRPILDFILRKAGYVIEPLIHLEQLAPNLVQLQHGELLDTGVLCIVLGVFVTGDPVYMEEIFRAVAMDFEAGLFYVSKHSRIPGHFGLMVRHCKQTTSIRSFACNLMTMFFVCTGEYCDRVHRRGRRCKFIFVVKCCLHKLTV